jgi:hypothetical protein
MLTVMELIVVTPVPSPLQQLRMNLCDEGDEIALERYREISAAPTGEWQCNCLLYWSWIVCFKLEI